jgi:hypothetical protein
MSDDRMIDQWVTDTNERQINNSPSVVQADTEMQQAEDLELRAANEKVISLDHLPTSPLSDAYDYGRRELDSQREGAVREEGWYENQYYKPNQKIVFGHDISTGKKLRRVLDDDNENVRHHTRRGIEGLNKSRTNPEDGPDAEGILSLGHLAVASRESGNEDYTTYARELQSMGYPDHAIQAGWNIGTVATQRKQIQEYLDDADPEEAVEAPPPDLTRDDLMVDEAWQSASQILYEAEEGKPFQGSAEDLLDWTFNEMSNFNWRTFTMANYARKALTREGEYAQALSYLVNTYDRVPTDFDIFGKSLGAFATDPVNVVGLGGGAVGTRLAVAAAKGRMKKILENAVARSAVVAAGAGATEGALFGGAVDAARQGVDIAGGNQEGFDAGRLGASVGIGTVAGAALGGPLGAALSKPALQMYGRAGRRMLENARSGQSVMSGSRRAQYGHIGDRKKGASNFKGKADRLGTRKPWGKNPETDPVTDVNRVDIDSMPEKALEKNVALMEKYSSLTPGKGTVRERAEHLKNQMTQNLLWLHDQMRPAIRERAKKWYDGARKNTERWAQKYDLSERQVAGIIAVLSPEQDWFINMSLAERVMDIWTDQSNFTPDKVMKDKGKELFSRFRKQPKEKWTKSMLLNEKLWKSAQGKTLAEIDDPYVAGMWLRVYDEAHNPRSHRMWTPEGEMLGMAQTKQGDKAAAWGYGNATAKAIQILRDGSMESVSEALGRGHKVRNFYNNIIAPLSPNGEVTIDTHAVAAAMLEPFGGANAEVGHNLGGGSGSANVGAQGTYGIIADAYREAAAQRGILPREMQSITWEEVRTLFTNKSPKAKAAVKSIWKDYKDGKITLSEAREKVHETAGGTSDPAWAESGPGLDAGQWDSTYKSGVPEHGVSSGDTPSGAGRDSRGDASGDSLDDDMFGGEVKIALGKIRDADIEAGLQDPNVTTVGELKDYIKGLHKDFHEGDTLWLRRKLKKIGEAIIGKSPTLTVAKVVETAISELPPASKLDVAPPEMLFMASVFKVIRKLGDHIKTNPDITLPEAEDYIRSVSKDDDIADEAIAEIEVKMEGLW